MMKDGGSRLKDLPKLTEVGAWRVNKVGTLEIFPLLLQMNQRTMVDFIPGMILRNWFNMQKTGL